MDWKQTFVIDLVIHVVTLQGLRCVVWNQYEQEEMDLCSC